MLFFSFRYFNFVYNVLSFLKIIFSGLFQLPMLLMQFLASGYKINMSLEKRLSILIQARLYDTLNSFSVGYKLTSPCPLNVFPHTLLFIKIVFMASTSATKVDTHRLVSLALIAAGITIVYNIAEGLVSVIFGINDETLALLGFGIDSFVEVLSGVGILHMIVRMKRAGLNDVTSRDRFESQALKITGTAFYILTAGLVVGSVLNIIQKGNPETTTAGIIISAISIVTMFVLMRWKLSLGRKLRSDAIIADANCTKTCFYLSFILLASSVLFETTSIAWFDIAGSLGIAWFAFSEGKESFEKAKKKDIDCAC